MPRPNQPNRPCRVHHPLGFGSAFLAALAADTHQQPSAQPPVQHSRSELAVTAFETTFKLSSVGGGGLVDLDLELALMRALQVWPDDLDPT